MLPRSVEIACEARDIYFQKCATTTLDGFGKKVCRRRHVLVAASVGSYGAYLADGSEYRYYLYICLFL